MSLGIVVAPIVIAAGVLTVWALSLAIRDALADRRWRLTPRARALAALGEAVEREVP